VTSQGTVAGVLDPRVGPGSLGVRVRLFLPRFRSIFSVSLVCARGLGLIARYRHGLCCTKEDPFRCNLQRLHRQLEVAKVDQI
jgi:hypothetical protein